MIDTNILKYVLIGTGILFAIIIVIYIVLTKKMGKSEYKQLRKLRQGTETSAFSLEIIYQKLYITFSRTPFLKGYILKLRRRLEILNIDDEYATRRDSAKILSNSLLILIPIVTLSIIITHSNYLLLSIILIFRLV